MKNKIEKIKKHQNRKLHTTIFGSLVSFLSLFYTTFAWFTFVRSANTNADKITITDHYGHEFNYSVDGVPQQTGKLNFFGFYPGNVHKRNLTFSLKNISDGPYQFRLSLKTQEEMNEVPYHDTANKWGGNKYYYLGSQIQVSKVELLIDNTTPSFESGVGSYLLTTSSEGLLKGQINGVSSPIEVMTTVDLFKNVTIPNGKTLMGTIEFTFIDNGTDQSMFMQDWANSGTCIRYLEGAITK